MSKPERPPLVSGKKTKCGRCVYFRSHHPKLQGDCRDVYGVKSKTRACEDFTLDVNPSYYRGHPAVKKYNEIAEDRYEEVPLLVEEVRNKAGSTFTRSQTRAGKKKELRRVLEVLKKEEDTSALIPFLEEVQANRDRVSEIQSRAIQWHGEIEEIVKDAESFLISKFPEIRGLKPEAVRKSIMHAILAQVYHTKARIESLHNQCDAALRNFYAQHNALIEIQVSARSPVNIPGYSLSKMKEEGKSPIRRKRGRRKKKR